MDPRQSMAGGSGSGRGGTAGEGHRRGKTTGDERQEERDVTRRTGLSPSGAKGGSTGEERGGSSPGTGHPGSQQTPPRHPPAGVQKLGASSLPCQGEHKPVLGKQHTELGDDMEEGAQDVPLGGGGEAKRRTFSAGSLDASSSPHLDSPLPPQKKICAGPTPPMLQKEKEEEREDSLEWEEESREDQTGSEHGSPREKHCSTRKSRIDLEAILQSLPTKKDLDTSLNIKFDKHAHKIESLFKEELRELKEEVGSISTKMVSLESEMASVKQKMGALENSSHTSQQNLINMALQLMDLENRDRRNNLRFRGIPESVEDKDLHATVTAICNHYLDRAPNEFIELDRVHRVFRRRNVDNTRPRDVLCRIHFFVIKERVIRKAWDKGPMKLEESEVLVLQDLAGKTLAMRRALKPILDVLKKKGALYTWGYPFNIRIRWRGNVFVLKVPSQLPELFSFLEVQPFEMPDWMEILLEAPR